MRIEPAQDRQGNFIPIFLYDNPYGFRLNVYHPNIIGHYMRWRKKQGLSTIYPISDKDRIRYEDLMIEQMYRSLPEEQRPIIPQRGGQDVQNDPVGAGEENV